MKQNPDIVSCLFVHKFIDRMNDDERNNLESFIYVKWVNKKIITSHDIYPNIVDYLYKKNISNFIEIIAIDNSYFTNKNTYSELLFSEYFYSLFVNYTFIFICQLDVRLFDSDLLNEAVKDMEYYNLDYLGAPWIFSVPQSHPLDFVTKRNKCRMSFYKRLLNIYFLPRVIKRYLLNNIYLVGNGGASIRRIEKHLDVVREFNGIRDFYVKTYGAAFLDELRTSKSVLQDYLNEDIVLALECGHKLNKLSISSPSLAIKYFWEHGGIPWLKHLNKDSLPLAVHQTYLYNH